MSMKKKFLALALAGAVAMPVVASASTNTQGVSGLDSQTHYADVNINGTVNTKAGAAADGRIEVILPTDMSFTVDKDGRFISANNYNITNNSKCSINVAVTEFKEADTNSGIFVLNYDTVNAARTDYDRATVGLKLTGDSNSSVNLVDGAISAGTLFTNLQGGGTTKSIDFSGVAGTATAATATNSKNTGVDTNGANETFKVKFKISKNS